jgi:hypothetical protein
MVHKRKYILISIVVFVMFELITGGGCIVTSWPYHKSIHGTISNGLDNEVDVNVRADGFPQRIYHIPLIVTISSWDEPGGIMVTFNRKKTPDDIQDDFHNAIESIQLSELAIFDNFGNRFIHPVQFECIFGKEINPAWADRSFEFKKCIYSDREYEIQLRGQVVYSDGSKKDLVVKESFKFEKDFLVGIKWLLLNR